MRTKAFTTGFRHITDFAWITTFWNARFRLTIGRAVLHREGIILIKTT